MVTVSIPSFRVTTSQGCPHDLSCSTRAVESKSQSKYAVLFTASSGLKHRHVSNVLSQVHYPLIHDPKLRSHVHALFWGIGRATLVDFAYWKTDLSTPPYMRFCQFADITAIVFGFPVV